MGEPRNLSPDHPPLKDLERLVELGIKLDELLRAARSEGEGLLAQARERVAQADALWASDLDAGRRGPGLGFSPVRP